MVFKNQWNTHCFHSFLFSTWIVLSLLRGRNVQTLCNTHIDIACYIARQHISREGEMMIFVQKSIIQSFFFFFILNSDFCWALMSHNDACRLFGIPLPFHCWRQWSSFVTVPTQAEQSAFNMRCEVSTHSFDTDSWNICNSLKCAQKYFPYVLVQKYLSLSLTERYQSLNSAERDECRKSMGIVQHYTFICV